MYILEKATLLHYLQGELIRNIPVPARRRK